MTPGESSTDQSPAAIVDLEADLATTDVSRRADGRPAGLVADPRSGVATVLLGVRYIAWQISISPGTPLATVFIVCEALALATFLLTFGALLDRGTRAGPGTPTGSLDVFITVCGEPLDVVEVAIRTAMAIDYPHRTVVLNDGRIAGEAGLAGDRPSGRATRRHRRHPHRRPPQQGREPEPRARRRRPPTSSSRSTPIIASTATSPPASSAGSVILASGSSAPRSGSMPGTTS